MQDMQKKKDKKETRSGNLAVMFEKPEEKDGDSKVALQYAFGGMESKVVIGAVVKGTADSELGLVECWVFKPASERWGPEIKRKRSGEVKHEVNKRLFRLLVGSKEESA